MSRSAELVAAALLLAAPAGSHGYEGIGRPATPAEIRAWDIDVRPDFQGLPPGSGSVARGQEVWDARCASCHGTFGESNEVFPPLVGGTTPEDVKVGRVAALADPAAGRTTLMKLSTLSTLFDYVRRAMPWDAPRSLSDDDTYAVVAHMLNLGEIVPADFVLDQDSIRRVQEKVPNRDGMTRAHGLWDVKGEPDVRAPACMKGCGTPRVTSTLPEFARNSHGNLAEQSRSYGPFRGADTTRPPGVPPAAAAAAPPPEANAGLSLARGSGCFACHAVDGKRLGPSFRDLAARYRGDARAQAHLASKVRGGGQGAWGAVPMPPQPQLAEKDIAALVTWILEGAP
jgi:cytochrome c